jgi:multicomponent Na+:H+ antiporter subunit A
MIAGRSMVVQTGVQLASPLAVVVALFLFFAGHNQPGGGFAAGLVLGAVVALRMVVGLPTFGAPVTLLAVGGVITGLVALAPIVAGEVVLDQVIVETNFPLLGKVKAGTALVFDLGVTLVVVGLMAAVLDALGAARIGEDPTVSAPQRRGAR